MDAAIESGDGVAETRIIHALHSRRARAAPRRNRRGIASARGYGTVSHALGRCLSRGTGRTRGSRSIDRVQILG